MSNSVFFYFLSETNLWRDNPLDNWRHLSKVHKQIIRTLITTLTTSSSSNNCKKAVVLHKTLWQWATSKLVEPQRNANVNKTKHGNYPTHQCNCQTNCNSQQTPTTTSNSNNSWIKLTLLTWVFKITLQTAFFLVHSTTYQLVVAVLIQTALY